MALRTDKHCRTRPQIRRTRLLEPPKRHVLRAGSSQPPLPSAVMRRPRTARLRALMLTDVIDTSGAGAMTRLLCVWTPRVEEVFSLAVVAVERSQEQSVRYGKEQRHCSTASTQARRRRTFALIDHAFEAEVAWSLWRLSITYGFDDSRSLRRALRHAAIAGWNSATWVADGVPNGFPRASELAVAFERGRAMYVAAMELQSTNGKGESE